MNAEPQVRQSWQWSLNAVVDNYLSDVYDREHWKFDWLVYTKPDPYSLVVLFCVFWENQKFDFFIVYSLSAHLPV